MFNIGGGELLVIVLIALIVLGPQRLPDAMRTFGRVVGEIRRISTGFQQEVRQAFEDTDAADEAGPPRRREAAPLAAAVAEIDAVNAVDDGDEGDDDAASSGEAASTTTPGTADAGTSVAPVIAEALDAIVPPGTSGEPETSTGAPTAESGPGLGDERAAS